MCTDHYACRPEMLRNSCESMKQHIMNFKKCWSILSELGFNQYLTEILIELMEETVTFRKNNIVRFYVAF